MSSVERISEQRDISKEAVLASLQTVLQSKTFSHSPSLRQTLEFVVRSSLASSTEPIKEYAIATEVLGRTREFDPKVDNIVRVQMHRLREKLEEYTRLRARVRQPGLRFLAANTAPNIQADPNQPPAAQAARQSQAPVPKRKIASIGRGGSLSP